MVHTFLFFGGNIPMCYRKRKNALRFDAFAPHRARAAKRQNTLLRPVASAGGLSEAKNLFRSR